MAEVVVYLCATVTMQIYQAIKKRKEKLKEKLFTEEVR